MKNDKRYKLLSELDVLVQPFNVNDDLSDESILKCFNILKELVEIINEDKRDLQKEFNELINEIFEVFNNLDTSLFTEEAYHNGDFYFEDLHQELIEGLFCEIDKKIYKYYNQNNLFEVMFILLATYYVILKKPEVIDEYNVFDMYDEVLYDYWQGLFIKFIDTLQKATLTPEEKEKFNSFLKTLDKSNVINDIYKILQIKDFSK